LKYQFQSTLPRRERLLLAQYYLKRDRFQSTLPRRERQKIVDLSLIGGDISIHAPTQGATRNKDIGETTVIFQSTLPRRERPHGQSYAVIKQAISIHAPTQGATHTAFHQFQYAPISIHAPTQGATLVIFINAPIYTYFNPRSHAGSDVQG